MSLSAKRWWPLYYLACKLRNKDIATSAVKDLTAQHTTGSLYKSSVARAVFVNTYPHTYSGQWASCQIRKIEDSVCAGNAGYVFPATVSDPDIDMHHGTAERFPLNLGGGGGGGGKRSRHSRRMRDPQFYVGGERSRHSRRMRDPQFYVPGPFISIFYIARHQAAQIVHSD